MSETILKPKVTGDGHGIVHIKREIAGQTVLDAARERMAVIFDTVDTPVVSFSGGKDSTVMLELAYEEAQKRGQPLHVFMCDDEVIDPDTIAFCERTRLREGIIFHWVCVPIRHTLRSEVRTCWYTWDPAYRDVWARDMPEQAITDIPGDGIRDLHIYEIFHRLFDENRYGQVGDLVGTRCQESFNRMRKVLEVGSFSCKPDKNVILYKPIYDWRTEDVWWAIKRFGWDYSAIYDKMQRYGTALRYQRVAPWGNVAASKETAQWAEFYPEAWERALRRLPELKAQSRYGRSKMFQQGREKPVGFTWQEWVYRLIEQIDDPMGKRRVTAMVRSTVKRWSRHYSLPFPEEPLKEISGLEGSDMSWKKLATAISKNDSIKGQSRDTL